MEVAAFDALAATPRETAILRRARWLLDSEVASDPELVRKVFLRTILSRDQDIGPLTQVDVDTSESTHVTVRLTLLSALDWDRLHAAGLLTDGVHAQVRPHFRDHGKQRRTWHARHTLVRALAVHFLSTAGGGQRSFADADALYCAEVEPFLERWDRRSYRRIIKETEQYGPL